MFGEAPGPHVLDIRPNNALTSVTGGIGGSHDWGVVFIRSTYIRVVFFGWKEKGPQAVLSCTCSYGGCDYATLILMSLARTILRMFSQTQDAYQSRNLDQEILRSTNDVCRLDLHTVPVYWIDLWIWDVSQIHKMAKVYLSRVCSLTTGINHARCLLTSIQQASL